MEIVELIDRLEAMAAQARKMPITGRPMVDAERVGEIVGQMRASVPRNLQSADEVLQRREAIVNQTMLDARRIRATAENDARLLVEGHGLVKAAQERSESLVEEATQKGQRIIALAEQEARRRREGADRYSQETLAKLEEQTLAALNTIRAGQRVLGPSLVDLDQDSQPVGSRN